MLPANRNDARVLGSGLVALDLIVATEVGVTHSVGGTCANVLTILSSLGIDAGLVGKTGDDLAAALIRFQMESLGCDISKVIRVPDLRTRRITELLPGISAKRHRFTFTCPECKSSLPRNSEYRKKEAKDAQVDWAGVDLFFLDRPSPGGIYLAQEAREAGVPVMFEPPSSLASNRLQEALAVADIVKYSVHNFRDRLPESTSGQVRLLIETQEAAGLRYRIIRDGVLENWKLLPAFDARCPRDSAGAGDWCTAGFVREFVVRKKNWGWTDSEVESALTFGQALAAVSVCFLGALGALFALTGEELVKAWLEVLDNGAVPNWAQRQFDQHWAFGPAWPIDLRPTNQACQVCLLERYPS